MNPNELLAMQQSYGGPNRLPNAVNGKKIRSKREMSTPNINVPVPIRSQGLEAFNNFSKELELEKYNQAQQMKQDARDVALANTSGLGNADAIAAGSRLNRVQEPAAIHINDMKTDKGMYNPYTKRYGNKAWRNNNPGNVTGMNGLKFGASKIAHSKYGDKGDQQMLVFDDPQKGWKAMYTLMSSPSYNSAPASKAFSKWQSDQNAWNRIKNLYNQSGINLNKRFIDMTPNEKSVFMNIRAKQEGWTGQGITPSFFKNI